MFSDSVVSSVSLPNGYGSGWLILGCYPYGPFQTPAPVTVRGTLGSKGTAGVLQGDSATDGNLPAARLLRVEP